jgi:hypothetical protein
VNDGRSSVIVVVDEVLGVTAVSVQVTSRVATTLDMVTAVGGVVADAMPGRFTASLNVSGVTLGVKLTLETELPAAVMLNAAD